jgi:hypothetical protein
MRTKVTENGVNIPKAWLEGIDEVEIQKEQNMIIVVPVQADDPIRALGTADPEESLTNSSAPAESRVC